MNATLIKTKTAKKGARKARLNGVVSSQIHHFESNSEALSSLDLIDVINVGLPVGELDTLRETLEVPMDKLAFQLGISTATLHRRKTQGRLEPDESDRVLRFARLLGKAIAVMGDIEDAKQWLSSPQVGLGGAVPLDYAKTEIGGREVENLLGRIEYGVYS